MSKWQVVTDPLYTMSLPVPPPKQKEPELDHPPHDAPYQRAVKGIVGLLAIHGFVGLRVTNRGKSHRKLKLVVDRGFGVKLSVVELEGGSANKDGKYDVVGDYLSATTGIHSSVCRSEAASFRRL